MIVDVSTREGSLGISFEGMGGRTTANDPPTAPLTSRERVCVLLASLIGPTAGRPFRFWYRLPLLNCALMSWLPTSLQELLATLTCSLLEATPWRV